MAVRVGDLVLKPVLDVTETEWTQALLHAVQPDGFGIAAPMATNDGRWVHRGWSACRFVAGLRPAAPAWPLIMEAGLRFGDAVERVRTRGEAALASRTHRWAVADRVAWSEAVAELPRDAADVLSRITDRLDRPRQDRHFVHGDLSGNVFLDGSGMPVILDVSPYLRPREWAAAIVVADAVLWNNAPITVARNFIANRGECDLFARALIFRLVAEQLADHPRHGALLEPYTNVLAALL
jgi:uncharacterized protein (TIGR02569 family)